MMLGSSLFHARKRAGLTQEEVAERLGVSRQTIGKWEADRTRKMLRTAINELDAYIDKVRSDVTYPKRHAVRAVSAARLIRENYESMLQNLGGNLAQFAAAADAAQKLSSQIDTGSLASLVAQTAGIQEEINKNREMWESVARSMTDNLSAIQAPGLSSAIEAIGQQTQLQKLINEGSLANLTSPVTSVDWTALQTNALSNINMTALASFGNADLPTVGTDDIDDTSDEEPEESGSQSRG